MKIIMKTTPILVILILSFTTRLAAQGEGGYDAVFEKLVHEYTLLPDGSVDYHHFRQLKINSYQAFHRRFGETFVVYDPSRERVTVNDCHTIMADGSKVPLPPNALNEVLPRAASGAAPYHHLRELVITHTGLERGAVIYLDYLKKSFPASLPFSSGYAVLQEDVPVRNLTLILRVPEGQPFYHRMLQSDIMPEVSTANGMTTYRWDYHDLPANLHIPFQLPATDRVPVILWSTASNLETAWKQFMAQDAFALRVDGEMQLQADSLKARYADVRTFAPALMAFVQASFDTWDLDLSLTGFRPQKAQETWYRGGGTRLDIALMCAALARAAGFEAWPALSMPTALFDPGIAVKEAWTDPLVCFATPEGEVCLDPSRKNTRSREDETYGRVMLPIRPEAPLTTQGGDTRTARASYRFALELDKDMLWSGSAEVDLQGAANPWPAMVSDPELKVLAGSVKGFNARSEQDRSGVQVGRSRLFFSLTSKEPLQAFGEMRQATLPAFSDLGYDLIQRDWGSRYPAELMFPYGMEVEVSYRLTLPRGYHLSAKYTKVGLEYGGASLTRQVSGGNGEWTISYALKVSATIQKEYYDEFREMASLWNDPGLREIWVYAEK